MITIPSQWLSLAFILTYEVSFTEEAVRIGSFVWYANFSAKIHVETLFFLLLHGFCCSSVYLLTGDSTNVSCTFVNHLMTLYSNKHQICSLSAFTRDEVELRLFLWVMYTLCLVGVEGWVLVMMGKCMTRQGKKSLHCFVYYVFTWLPL